MKIYYFRYKDTEGCLKTEAFSSKTTAQRRVSELKSSSKEASDAWREYIIGGKRGQRPPHPIKELPAQIETVEFDIKSEGMLEAFIYLVNKEGLCK